MAFDSARGRMVLFGGSLRGMHASDTWEWDGTDWLQLHPLPRPHRVYGGMAYDSARGRSVLLAISATYQPETWEWDGVDWVQRLSSTKGGVLAYDSRRGRIVSYGERETWEYGPTQPASYAAFGTGCAGSAGTPALEALAGQRPWLDDWFTLELTSLPPGHSALVWLGRSRTAWGAVNLPLDLAFAGLPGCALRSSPEFAFPVFNLTGTARLDLRLPADNALLGAAFYNQALVADPGANAFGATLSNAGEGRFGGR